MALPWMESLRVWGDVKLESKQSSKAPTRMGILFSGCGFHTHEWWAKGEGKRDAVRQGSKSSRGFSGENGFIRGLYNAEALKGKYSP